MRWIEFLNLFCPRALYKNGTKWSVSFAGRGSGAFFLASASLRASLRRKESSFSLLTRHLFLIPASPGLGNVPGYYQAVPGGTGVSRVGVCFCTVAESKNKRCRENSLNHYGKGCRPRYGMDDGSRSRSSLGFTRDFACGLRRPAHGSTSTPTHVSLRYAQDDNRERESSGKSLIVPLTVLD
jgi:hypothetical protein